MADEQPQKQYEYGLTPEMEGEGLASLFTKVVGAFTPLRSEVIRPRETRFVDVDGAGIREVIPGEYEEPDFSMRHMPVRRAVSKGLDYFSDFFTNPETRVAAARTLAGIPEALWNQQTRGAEAWTQGYPSGYDPETGEEFTFDPLLVPAMAAPAGILLRPSGTFVGSLGGKIDPPGTSKYSPVYKSEVARAVDALPMDKGPGEQMLAMVSKSSGVKPEEIEWTGLASFLKDKKSVTKQEIQDFINTNKLQLIEDIRGVKGSGLSDLKFDDRVQSYEGPATYDLLNRKESTFANAYVLRAWSGDEAPAQTPTVTGQPVVGEKFIRHDVDIPDLPIEQLDELSFNVAADFKKMGLRVPEALEEALETNILTIPQLRRHYLDNDIPAHILNETLKPFGEFRLFDHADELKDAVAYGDGTSFETLHEAQWTARTLLERLDKGEGRGKTRHAEWTEPGGTNYREVLLKMPDMSKPADGVKSTMEAAILSPEVARVRVSSRDFYSSHWPDDPNVLSHFRATDRVGPNNEKILFLEEIQSDWHQKGRREGYRTPVPPIDEATRKKVVRYRELESIGNRMALDTPREILDEWRLLEEELEPWMGLLRGRIGQRHGVVPDAPLKKTWHEMTFRRALRMAAEEGKDSVAWVPGMAQAMRYFKTNTPDYPAALHGMEEFYDEIIPNYANKFGKKFGAKVESNHIDFPKGGWPGKVWSFPITPEMREHLLREGVSTFAQGGFIDKPLYDRSL